MPPEPGTNGKDERAAHLLFVTKYLPPVTLHLSKPCRCGLLAQTVAKRRRAGRACPPRADCRRRKLALG